MLNSKRSTAFAANAGRLLHHLHMKVITTLRRVRENYLFIFFYVCLLTLDTLNGMFHESLESTAVCDGTKHCSHMFTCP